MSRETLVFRVATALALVHALDDAFVNANVRYDAASEGPVEHWNLPDATHTDAIHEHPEAYAQRVVGFFDGALG